MAKKLAAFNLVVTCSTAQFPLDLVPHHSHIAQSQLVALSWII